MTENELIDRLKKEIDILNKAPVHVNKLKDLKIAVEAREMAISALSEIQQYRALGTVEELREAREKQRAKKAIKYLKRKKLVIGKCPHCRRLISCRYERRFCNKCGQAIDWSEEE